MEEKKKKTTKKSTTSKTVKKTSPKVEKKEAVKEVKKAPKKVAKKTTSKKKSVEKIDIPVIEKESKKKASTKEETLIEKTYIFNKKEKENIEQVINELDKNKIFVEDKVVERSPLNKGLIIFLVFAIVAVIVGCTIYAFYNTKDDGNSPLEYENDLYKSITIDDGITSEGKDDEEKVVMKDIDYSNVINTTLNDFEVKLVEGKDMIVLISSSTCYYCITFEPVLNEVLAAKKDTALRLNITNMTTEETRRLRKYFAFTSAPTLLVIRNGQIKADTSGYMDKEEFTAWYEENVK